jgi:hypothetical protein
MATARDGKHPEASLRGLQEVNTRWRNAARPRSRSAKAPGKGSWINDDLVEAFEGMATHLRVEIELNAHEV